MTMRRVYMDANATTPLLPEVFEAMRPYFVERFGNASSVHSFGQQARGAVEQARIGLAAFLHCRPAEIVFTSGGTESDNLALFGATKPGDHVITTSIEHHAVIHAAERLLQCGREVTFLPVNAECVVDPDDVRRALRPNTRLISVMMANNETGAIQPVEEIGGIAAEAGVQFHTDAVQTAGKLALDVEKIDCNLLSISGHKMHAPQGTGVLFVRKDTKIEPLFYGGTHERQRRAGTENLAGIVGLGKAAEIARKGIEEAAPEKMRALRDRHGARNYLPRRRSGSALRACAARAEHNESLVRSPGRRGAGDCARPEGACDFGRLGLRLGSERAFSCADSNACARRACARQPALQSVEVDDGGGCRFRH